MCPSTDLHLGNHTQLLLNAPGLASPLTSDPVRVPFLLLIGNLGLSRGCLRRTPMSNSDTPTRGPARPGPYIIAGVILTIGIVLPLAVPMYAMKNPELLGFPFFYWYQILWIFAESGLLWITYAIVTREDNRRRAAVHKPESDHSSKETDE